jgi:radical SAM-linked protein
MPPAATAAAAPPPSTWKKVQVAYSKLGPARFFGHLELVNLFLRALRRAAIPVKYSEGFHPKPRVAFDDPLPTGYESEDERLVVTVGADVPPRRLVDGLNAGLPEGLHVWDCSESIEPVPAFGRFRVRFDPPVSDLSRVGEAWVDRERELEIPSSKGKLKKVALKDILKQTVVSDQDIVLELSREPGKCVRPTDVLVHAFGLPPQAVASARVTRLKRP